MDRNLKELLSVVSIVLTIGVVGVLLVLSVQCVPVGHKGVMKHWGKVSHDFVLSEGLHFVAPIRTTIQNMSIKLRKYEQKTSASSKDLQTVSTVVSVQYSLANVSGLYQKMGDEDSVEIILLSPGVQESVKAVTAQFTAEELIKKRSEVKVSIEEKIQDFLYTTLENKKLDKLSLNIENIAITDFDFSPEFNKSIEMKVKAEQEALQAKNEKLKKITDSEATAEQIRLESIAKANAIKREARALAENPLLIEYKRMEKWNGQLPRVTGGAIPMFDVGGNTSDEKN